MFTHTVDFALLRELRIFYRLSRLLVLSTTRIIGHLFFYSWQALTWLIVPPKLTRRTTLEEGVGREVTLPSQTPKWILNHLPAGLDSER